MPEYCTHFLLTAKYQVGNDRILVKLLNISFLCHDSAVPDLHTVVKTKAEQKCLQSTVREVEKWNTVCRRDQFYINKENHEWEAAHK